MAQLSIATIAGAVAVAVWYLVIWKVLPVIAAATEARGLMLPFSVRIAVAFASYVGRFWPLLTLAAGGGFVLAASIPRVGVVVVRWGPVAALAAGLGSLAATTWLLLVLLLHVVGEVLPGAAGSG